MTRETLKLNIVETFGIETQFIRYLVPIPASSKPSAPDDFWVSKTVKQMIERG